MHLWLKSPRQHSNDLWGSMCDSRNKLSCSSNCCIVLTPAQVIMGCYSVCQSAHSRLLCQPLLPVTIPSLQKPFRSNTMWLLCKESLWLVTPLPVDHKWNRKIPAGTGSHWDPLAHTCSSRNDPWHTWREMGKGAGCCGKELVITRTERQYPD